MKKWVAAILMVMLLILPTASRANHDFVSCEYFIALPDLILRLCSYDKPAYEKSKVVDVLQAALKNIKPEKMLKVTVIVADGILDDNIHGIFEPVTKAIFISGGSETSPTPPHYRFYYTLGHELVHAIMDQQHVSWDDQHCLMLSTPVLKPLRELLLSWGSEIHDQLGLLMSCNHSG